ncbi:MAG: winged helix-turn-helix domain-containing protein [Candidatus ainarchaeum sp.]|nr:winged helix-turn-helix domain-containing protein [Candidatus ainarchaeum sp.]
MEPMKRLLYWLLEGTKGGPTRIQLLSILLRKPMNLNRLAREAKLDYKTVEHHVQMLAKNSILESEGGDYGRVYFVSESVLSQPGFMGILKGDKNGKKGKR